MPETLVQHDTVTQPGASPLQAESVQNTGSILGEAKSEFGRVGFMGSEEFDTGVQQRTEAIEASHHTSINMTVASLDRMLSTGAHESAWSHQREVGAENVSKSSTAQGKNIHEGYFEQRAAVESQLGSYVEDPGNGEPVYAAVASNDREYLHGACPEYGEVAVILDESKIDPDSTVYSWSDSLVSSLGRDEQNEITVDKPKVLTKEDAMVTKAVVDMLAEYNKRFPMLAGNSGLAMLKSPEDRDKMLSVRAGYVETILFQDVTPDMIQAVSINGAIPEAARIISEHPEIADKAIFVVGDNESDLVKDYLATHFTAVKQDYKSGAIEHHTVDPKRWEELGVDVSADSTTIKQALLDKAQGLLKSRTELSRLAMFNSAGVRMDTARGMKQVLNSIKSTITESPSHEQLRQQYNEALKIQEALRFFEVVAPEQQPPTQELI